MRLLLLLLAGCHHGPRCFQDSSPPPWHYQQAPHTLINGLDATPRTLPCPLDPPAMGASCNWSEDTVCYYVAPQKPCDPTAITYTDGHFASTPVVF